MKFYLNGRGMDKGVEVKDVPLNKNQVRVGDWVKWNNTWDQITWFELRQQGTIIYIRTARYSESFGTDTWDYHYFGIFRKVKNKIKRKEKV